MNQFSFERRAIRRKRLVFSYPMDRMITRGANSLSLAFEMANQVAMRHATIALPVRNRTNQENIALNLVVQTSLDYPIKASIMIYRYS